MPAQRFQALGQPVDGFVKRPIVGPVARQPPRESLRQGPVRQLERIAKVPASERRITKLDKGDLSQRHVGPDVVVTGRKCIPQRIASRLRIAGLPELDPLFIVELGLLDARGCTSSKSSPPIRVRPIGPGLDLAPPGRGPPARSRPRLEWTPRPGPPRRLSGGRRPCRFPRPADPTWNCSLGCASPTP